MKQPGDTHGFGGPGPRTKQQWVVAAQAAIINLLDQQLAAPESRSTAACTSSG
jgi:hypothetical protein